MLFNDVYQEKCKKLYNKFNNWILCLWFLGLGPMFKVIILTILYLCATLDSILLDVYTKNSMLLNTSLILAKLKYVVEEHILARIQSVDVSY